MLRIKNKFKKITCFLLASTIAFSIIVNTKIEVASARTLRGLITQATRDINQYWKYQLNASGRRYTPPRLYRYNPSQPITTACGLSLENNASYCPGDNSISFDTNFLSTQYNKYGDYAVVHILAHEWGHLVQNQMGINRNQFYSIQLELQADCFAGAYARRASDAGFLEAGDLGEAVTSAIAGGDPGTPWFAPGAHGSSEQRVTAFSLGLNGPGACFSRY